MEANFFLLGESEEMELQTIFLIIGGIGVTLVLMYSISMGVANKHITTGSDSDNQCASNPGSVIKIPKYIALGGKASYNLSTLLPAGSCPVGYTHFADAEGNTLCCGSNNIDIFSHVCSASGSEGICSMVPGIEDYRSPDRKPYPVCQEIARQQEQARSGKLCPRFFPKHVFTSGINGPYKCCKGALNAAKTDCDSGPSCAGLIQGQTMFSHPDSCETKRLLEKVTCPVSTNLVEKLKGTSLKTKNLMMPVCIGVKGNCIDSNVLKELRATGLFQDIDPEKNIMNCDVYNKVYNERSMAQSLAEMKHSVDLG